MRTPAGQVFALLGLRWLRVGARLLELRTSCLRAGLADLLEVVGSTVTRKCVGELESCGSVRKTRKYCLCSSFIRFQDARSKRSFVTVI